MKKLISFVLALALCCMLVSAVADVDVTGAWYMKTMKAGDVEYDASAMGLSMTIILNEDGTAATQGMGGAAQTGTWTLDGDQITVTIDGAPASGTVTEETLTLEADGQTMILTREAPAGAIEVADVVAAESIEEFYGEYVLTYMDMDGSLVSAAVFGGMYPNLKLDEGVIEFVASSEQDIFAAIFNVMGLQGEFADGVMNVAATLEGADTTGMIEKLEDGMIKVTLINGEENTIFYYAPAEAAEEPAA